MTRLTLPAAMVLLLLAPPALAQSKPPMPPPATGAGQHQAGRGDGMMGGGMMMHRRGFEGRMMERRIAAAAAGNLAYLRVALGITKAEEPKWQTFADSVRAAVKGAIAMRRSMQGLRRNDTVPDRLARWQQAMAKHQAALQKTVAALDALYAALTPDQKRIIDRMPIGPMGMPMGMR
jgi:LTXXQ motif family protein